MWAHDQNVLHHQILNKYFLYSIILSVLWTVIQNRNEPICIIIE